MFQGTLPRPVLKIVGKAVKEWDVDRIYVGCSGNFTIERHISNLIDCPITSNDVTIYSSYIGKFLAGEQLSNIAVRQQFADKYELFTKYMTTNEQKIATLIIASDMLPYDKPGVYYQRMYNGYVEQFPRIHEQLVKKLQKVKTKIDTFYHGDVIEMLDQIGPNDGFVCFPPFWSGGYEKMWKKLEEVFFYQTPQYNEFDPDGTIPLFCNKVKKLDNYLICMERPISQLSDDLIGQSETSNGKAVFIYGKSKERHFIEARTKETKGKPIVKIGKEDRLTGKIQIKQITLDQFIENKSMYLSVRVKSTTNPQAMFGLFDDNKCFGFFGISNGYMFSAPEAYEGPSTYLLSDFAVGPTSIRKLSKLVLYCVLSKEVHIILERLAKKRIKLINTNVFSNKPVSMKYRGVFELAGSKPAEKDQQGNVLVHNLTYVAKPGQWTLEEGYQLWKQKS